MKRCNTVKIVWNQEKVTRRVQKTLRLMIVVLVERTLLTVVSLERTRPCVVRKEVLQMFGADGKIFFKSAWGYCPSKERQDALLNMELSQNR